MIAAANKTALTPPVWMVDPPAVTTLLCEGAAVWTVVGTVPLLLGLIETIEEGPAETELAADGTWVSEHTGSSPG